MSPLPRPSRLATRPLAHPLAVAALLLASGCFGRQPDEAPAAMSAYDHRAEGRRHDRRARAATAKYEPTARASTPLPLGLAVVPNINADAPELGHIETGYAQEHYNPTAAYLARALEHRRHARQHFAAALALEQSTNAACSGVSPEVRASCPVLGAVVAAEPLPDGVRFVLRRSTDPSATLAHMRCHHAFGVERHFAFMTSCPLYLPALRIEAGADGRSVVVRSDEPAVVRALQRRARATVSGAESPAATEQE